MEKESENINIEYEGFFNSSEFDFLFDDYKRHKNKKKKKNFS
jgi:hypothetical protein